ACAKLLADPGLSPEALAVRVEELAGAGLDGPPGQVLASMLASLEEQAQQYVAQDDPGNWAKQALTKVRDWLGHGVGNTSAGECSRSILASRPARLRRVFVVHLTALARQCLADDLTAAVQQFFTFLGGRVGERIADVNFCRQRLRHLQQALEAGLVDIEEASG